VSILGTLKLQGTLEVSTITLSPTGITISTPTASIDVSVAGAIDITSVGRTVVASQITLDGTSWNHSHMTSTGLSGMPQDFI